jgi:hemerythrin HHE cation binding domain-containing protein
MPVSPFAVSGPPDSRSMPAVLARLGQRLRAFADTVGEPDGSSRPGWLAEFRVLLEPVRAAFAEHRAVTEGDEGVYAELILDAPRLAGTVADLVAEHAELDRSMAALASRAGHDRPDLDGLRRQADAVIDHLARHREQDADLVYQAYSMDLGGE